jgi:hypothetical protein
MIGAYRDNEVDAAHPLARKLEAIRNAGASLSEIKLAPDYALLANVIVAAEGATFQDVGRRTARLHLAFLKQSQLFAKKQTFGNDGGACHPLVRIQMERPTSRDFASA